MEVVYIIPHYTQRASIVRVVRLPGVEEHCYSLIPLHVV